MLTAYYTDILGDEVVTMWPLDLDSLYSGTEQADSEPLVAPFTEREALTAIHAMAMDSALGSDGMGLAFYKVAWSTAKGAILHFLHTFYDGAVDLQRINRALIILIPKKEVAVAPGDFHLVSLQNYPMKILKKLLTSRLQL